MKILFPLLLLFSIAGFGQYTIPQDYFISQFSDSTTPSRIYCMNKKGEKIWLTNIISFYMTLKLKDSGLKSIVLTSARYKNGMVEGMELNETLFKKDKSVSVSLSDVSIITIFPPYSVASPYYDFDSSKKIWNAKNDSLNNYFSSGSVPVIYFISKNKSKPDSILIFENACYNIIFKDNAQTNSGVVEKITRDSIYISSSFNINTAMADKVDYKILQYSINDITALRLLKGGGFSYKKINTSDYDLTVVEKEKNKLMRPCFVKINPRTGEIYLYRRLLTLTGFAAIMEKNGKTYWYETN